MRLRDDERAQSVQIGAVLLFGTLIIAFSSYQAFVVPDQNEEVEFNHNQQVQGELQDLRNVIVSSSGSGTARSTSIQLGTRYPSRAVAANPGPPSGALRTVGTDDDTDTFDIDNARATDSETADFWTGDPRPYDTGRITYDPSYNRYTNAPVTVYEGTVLHNQFRDGNVVKSGQVMVDGRDLTIVTVDGSLDSTSAGSTTVDVRPVSGSDRTVDVTNAGGDITLSFRSRLPPAAWEDVLAEEYDPDGSEPDKYVADVSGSSLGDSRYAITLTMESGEYDLSMAKVGVGTQVDDETAAYLTDIEGDGDDVVSGDSREVVLEVRDAYNNPVEGVRVYGGVDPASEGSLVSVQPVSDDDGRVVFEYRTQQSTAIGPKQLNFAIPGVDENFDGGAPENATIEVSVTTGSGDGGGGNTLTYNDDATAVNDADNWWEDTPAGVQFSVTNNYLQNLRITDVTIDPANDRIDFLSDERSGEGQWYSELYIDSDVNDGLTDIGNGADVPDDGLTIDLSEDGAYDDWDYESETSAGETATVYLYRFHEEQGNSGNYDPSDMTGESIDITIQYELDDGTTGSSTFTVSPS